MKSRLLLVLFLCFALMELIAQPGQSNSDRNTRVLQAIELALRDPNTPPLRKQRLLAMKKIIEKHKGENPESLFNIAMTEVLRRFPGGPDREFFDKIKPTQVKEEPAGKPASSDTDTTTVPSIFGGATDFGKLAGPPPLPAGPPPSSGNTVPGIGGPAGFGKWLVNPCPDHDDPGPVNPGSVQKSPTNNAEAKKTAENENLNRKAIADINQKLKSIDKIKDPDRVKALEAMKKYIQDHINDDPRKVLDGAAQEAKKALATGDKTKDAESSSMVDQMYGLIKSLFDYVIKITDIITKAMGTGLTTGNIANIFVTNNNDYSITIIPQTFFIPSDGQYQSYIGRIEDCIPVPPNGTAVVTVTGYCTDVHSPPVPVDTEMPPLEDWIPVGGPFDSVPPGNFPQVLEDMNPTASPGPSSDGYQVVIITNDPQTSFTPEAIPDFIESPGYNPVPPDPEDDIIITWPGTDIPVDGTFDPRIDPQSFARVIVSLVERVEDAAEVIQDSGDFPTPFTRDPPREFESFCQQMIWRYTAAVTGDEYAQEDFAANVYDQFEDKTGVVVSSLPEERKDDLDAGIDDFWNAFQAVGVEAKVISVESPGLGQNVIEHFQTSIEAPVPIIDENKLTQCQCGTIDLEFVIRYSVLNKHGEWLVSSEIITHNTTTHEADSGGGQVPEEIEVKRTGLKKGSIVRLHIVEVSMDCPCSSNAPCDVFKDAAEEARHATGVPQAERAEAERIKKDLDDELRKAIEELKNAENDDLKKPIQQRMDETPQERDNSPVGIAMRKIESLKDSIKRAEKKVADSTPGKPSIMDSESGEKRSKDWSDFTTPDFLKTKEVDDKPIEFSFLVGFYCKGGECMPIQCGRSFIIKVVDK